MKVIVANWVYNWGSTGFILRDICSGLQHLGVTSLPIAATTMSAPTEDAFIFANRHEMVFYSRLMRLGWPKFGGSTFATNRIIRFIKKEKPDVVHIHLLHCASCNLYSLLRWLGKNNIKTVITHHAELYYTGTCGHSFDCVKFIDNQCKGCSNIKRATGAMIGGNPHKNWCRMNNAFDYFKNENLMFTAVSPWVKERMELSPICNRFECVVVLNGIETNIFYHRDVPLTKKVLFVSAFFDPTDKEDVKGGWYLVKLAEQMPHVNFVIVSTSSKNIENLPCNMQFVGKAKDQDELAVFYSRAALTVLTSRKETFSMVCAESLCCGTPVVGFKAGGPESIAIKEYSAFVEHGDIESLKSAVEFFLNKSFVRGVIAREAHQKFSKKVMCEGYLNAYQRIIG